MITREMLLPFVAYVLDDALGVHPARDMLPNATLVVWQLGVKPMAVAVQSYFPDTLIDADEAAEIVIDYLREIKVQSAYPNYVIEGVR